MHLYFFRHGLAGSRSEWSGDDDDRPLTGEGRERIAREAAGLARLDLRLDLMLTSPLARAKETAEIVAAHLQLADAVHVEDRLRPGFGLPELTEVLDAYPDAQAVMLVGHEPDFSETAGRLTGGGGLVLKKGGLVYVEVKGRSLKKGRLVWLLPPKVLEV